MATVYLFEKTQFLDNSGLPLNGGLIYTYAAGTTTPLATYTDSTGATPNANPVVCDSAGRAQVWLTAAAYKLIVKTSAGVTMETIDGINAASGPFNGLTDTGDLTLQQTTAATSLANQSGNNLKIQGTYWNGSASANDTWNAQDVIGTGTNPTSTLTVTHSGSSGTASVFLGNIPITGVGAITTSGQLTSSVATGTAPFSVASTTQVSNLNVSQLEGKTWEVPGTIGSTTPNTGAFTTVNKVTITTPATGSTLTIADGKTLTASKTITFTNATDGTIQTFQASDTIVGRATTDTLTNKTLTGATSGNNTNLLNQQNPASAITGTGSAATVYTYSLPASTVASGKSIHLRAVFNHSTGSASVAYVLSLNGTTLLSFSSSTAGSHLIDIDIFNTGATTGSVMELFGATPVPAGQTIGSGLAWGSNQTLLLTFNVANTDQVAPQGWKVTLDQ